MREQEYRVPRAHGPKVAVIGGGHGLSNMLRGLKQYTENISAIVTVADDGGGSGMLRQDLGMPPPGDIRSCMEALANTEPVMRELLHYRFTEGSLAGQSFGNLFLAALNGISPSFDAAVRRMSQVLAITGRVLPVTTADVQLEAEFENGATVVGESKIFYCKKQEDCRIRQVRLIPSRPKALPEAVSAIADADMIVLGPGSLYTSIIPNLLVDGIVKAIRESDALKVYVCNVMTQEGETEGYTVSDHIAAIFAHSAQGLLRGGGGRAHPLRQVRLRGPGRGGRGAAGGHGGERLCPPQLRGPGPGADPAPCGAERPDRRCPVPPPGGCLPDGGAEMSPTITQSWRRPTHVLFL